MRQHHTAKLQNTLGYSKTSLYAFIDGQCKRCGPLKWTVTVILFVITCFRIVLTYSLTESRADPQLTE